MLHGYRSRFNQLVLRGFSATAEEWECPTELWEEANEQIQRSKENMKTAYNKHHHDNTEYAVGEMSYDQGTSANRRVSQAPVPLLWSIDCDGKSIQTCVPSYTVG